MGKIVGKILVTLLCMSSYLYADLLLKAYDTNGSQLKQAVVGQPFMLEVIVQNQKTSAAQPKIQGLDDMYVRNAGLMMTTINGDSTTKHRYKVRIDTAGNYTLGPATLSVNNQPLTSNTVTLIVTDQVPVQAQANKNKQDNVAFLRFKVAKDRVVVGEKIPCAVRFYYTDDVVNASAFEHPIVKGFTFNSDARKTEGTETVHGTPYRYFEISWDAYATEPGKKVIPAYGIDFVVRTHTNDYLHRISMFLGNQMGEQRRVYSNAATINVDPLPPYNKPVHAIGNFSQFSAKIEPGVAKEGEGMVLTLELEGDGNLDKSMSSLTLQGLPESFKYYDSKNYMVEKKHANEPTKQRFEFIVQGLHKGDWEIPAQSFTFFDAQSRSYITLKSLPLAVMIMPQAAEQQSVDASAGNGQSNYLQEIDDEIKPIMTSPAGRKQTGWALPWWLFICLMLMPFIAFVVDYIMMRYGYSYTLFKQRFAQKKAFALARSALEQAHTLNKINKFYGIFVQLFAARYQMPKSHMSQEFMLAALGDRGMKADDIARFNLFVTQLTEYAFFNKQATTHDKKILLEYARGWVDRLEKVL